MSSVDVLSDLRGVIRIAKAASVGVTGNELRIERAEKAVAAVAELIAADEELDAARAAIYECTEASLSLELTQRMADAWDRRAAALAACKAVTP